jgi:hypothetical protein
VPVSFDDVRAMALSMPEAVESAHFDHPDFRVRKKIFAGLRPEDGRAVLKLPKHEMESLISIDPKCFEGARGWERFGWTLVRVERLPRDQLRPLVEMAWCEVAPKRLVAEYRKTRG